MKNFISKFTITLILAGTSQALAKPFLPLEKPQPDLVPAPISQVYIPEGFDSNDQVELTIEGVFANSCYRAYMPETYVDRNKKQIVIESYGLFYNGYCLQALLPWNRTINFGTLPAGNYTISQKVNKKISNLGVLKIKPASTENADDYLYAPITQAYVDQKGLEPQIKITGEYYNSCLNLEDIHISYTENVIVVQPLTYVDSAANCRDGHFPFEEAVSIKGLPKGRYLLHVRSLNAQSINNIVSIH